MEWNIKISLFMLDGQMVDVRAFWRERLSSIPESVKCSTICHCLAADASSQCVLAQVTVMGSTCSFHVVGTKKSKINFFFVNFKFYSKLANISSSSIAVELINDLLMLPRATPCFAGDSLTETIFGAVLFRGTENMIDYILFYFCWCISLKLRNLSSAITLAYN